MQQSTSAVGRRADRHSQPPSTRTRHSQPKGAGPHRQQAQPRTCPGVLDGARCRDPCPSRAAPGAAGAALLLGVPVALLGSSSNASSCDCRSLAPVGAVLGRRGLGSCSQAVTVYCLMELAACQWPQRPGGASGYTEPLLARCPDVQPNLEVQAAASPGYDVLFSQPTCWLPVRSTSARARLPPSGVAGRLETGLTASASLTVPLQRDGTRICVLDSHDHSAGPACWLPTELTASTVSPTGQQQGAVAQNMHTEAGSLLCLQFRQHCSAAGSTAISGVPSDVAPAKRPTWPALETSQSRCRWSCLHQQMAGQATSGSQG